MKRNRSAKFKALLLLFLMALQPLAGYACIADPLVAPAPDTQHNTIQLPSGHHQADCCPDNPVHQATPDQLLSSPAADLSLYPGLLFLYPPPSFVFVFLSDEKVMPRHTCILSQQQLPISDIRIAIQSFQI